ncbi:MAG: GH36-type glycosyl hydrolase domain-containing protein, partial [Thermoanaerobaculia bacterium]
LFDKERKVFSIGWSAQTERLDNSYYDLLASEARLTSFWAIANGDVPTEHWFRLQRPFALSFKRPVLLSWSGSMFEYLMPLLLLRSYPDTLLHETCLAALEAQIQNVRGRQVPWGASESAYNARDLNLNYQYGPFGVPELGLRRVAPDELVISPYSTFLALLVDPTGAPENLRRLAAEGARGDFGFYESIDYTPGRVPPGSSRAVVKAFMAHHQGMILLSIHNAVLQDRMRNRFHSDPAVQATELLLQERIPRNTTALAGSIVAQVAAGRVVREEIAIPTRRFDSPDSSTPRGQILSNGSYSVLLTVAGSGFSQRGGLAVTRWRDDPTADSWGSWIYLRDVRSGQRWSAGYQPTGRRPKRYEAKFSEHKAEFFRSDDGIETRTEVTVSAQADVEIRRVTLTNTSTRARDERDIEVTSYAELVLAPPAADIAHPAFSKMFLETEWTAGCLLCHRRPRSPEEKPVFAAHTMAVAGTSLGGVQHETDRARFLGRGRSVRAPAVLVEDRPLSDTTGAVLDPIFSLRNRVRVPPGHSVQIAFTTSVADTREEALALADRFKDPSQFDREASLAWMRSQVLLRHLMITSDEAQLFQRLATRAFYNDASLRPASELLARNTGSIRELWAQGISGDLPIVLVRIADMDEIDLARQLLRAHEYWSLKGISVDLVIVNESPSGYLQPLQEQLNAILAASPSRPVVDKPGGIFVRSGDQIPEPERAVLEAAARAVLVGSKGTLSEQVERVPSNEILPAPFASTAPVAKEIPRPPIDPGKLSFFNGIGGFSADRREYVIVLLENQYTPAPWSNVISNPTFGFLVTESGSGCTWSENSHENRLTPWSNDPVTDSPGEAIYLRDEESGEVWTPTALPIRDAETYLCRHGQGYSSFFHRKTEIESDLVMFVPSSDPVKILRLRLTNHSPSARRISATFYAEWVLGSERSASARFVVTEHDAQMQAILARNAFNADFATRIAFARAGGSLRSWTADRREFLGRNGHLSDPAALRRASLSGRSGAALDPCAALQTSVNLDPGETRDVVFLLGEAADRDAIAEIVGRYGEPEQAEAALAECVSAWDRLLGAVQVKTPDLGLDLIVNRWLLYQTLSCRIWGRTGFYQSSGAFGFRDQLQDATALLAAAPDLAREQIVRAASRQFSEGDVQHWWHPPAGRGIRSRCSDDLLWLPFAAALFAEVTGDSSLWDLDAPFLDAPQLGSGEIEAYQEPRVSPTGGTIFDHCLRAIDRSLASGAHGLPLIGSGDWNDGYNRVGIGGKGESVWLGWFLASILEPFQRLCDERGDKGRAERYRLHAAGLKTSIEKSGWDGDWYRRAYFDDGSTLGSAADAECRIDSLSQTWAVLSGTGDRTRTARAMVAVREYLVRREDGLVLLLAPPFDRPAHDPGYIQGYPPGVRENGGQYTHAAAWAVMAFARLGDGDLAGELFSYVNPITPTSTRAGLHKYKVEPYVTAGDVYSVPPLTGRGGWTWYTGSSGWLYRAAVESILGFRIRGNHFEIEPCIPRRWPEFEIQYRDGETLYRIRVENPLRVCRGVESVEVDGAPAPEKHVCRHRDGKPHDVVVRLGSGS